MIKLLNLFAYKVKRWNPFLPPCWRLHKKEEKIIPFIIAHVVVMMMMIKTMVCHSELELSEKVGKRSFFSLKHVDIFLILFCRYEIMIYLCYNNDENYGSGAIKLTSTAVSSHRRRDLFYHLFLSPTRVSNKTKNGHGWTLNTTEKEKMNGLKTLSGKWMFIEWYVLKCFGTFRVREICADDGGTQTRMEKSFSNINH